MSSNKDKENNSRTFAQIAANGFIDLDINESAEKILIIGNTAGFFGYYVDGKNSVELDESKTNMEKLGDRIMWICDRLDNGAVFTIIANENTMKYYEMIIAFFKSTGACKFNKNKQVRVKIINNDDEYIPFINKLKNANMKFDYIIENPPYKGSLHLDFLQASLNMLDEKSGKFVMIQPSTFLINIRTNGKAKLYDEIKQKLAGHVYKVVIENCNKEFNIGLYTPCSITYIDMSKTFEEIEYICCGYKKMVNSLYDCNLIGSYDMIWSIINKVKGYGDMMKDHVYKAEGKNKSKVDDNTWYCKFVDIVGAVGCTCFIGSNPKNQKSINSEVWYANDVYYTDNGILWPYYDSLYHHIANDIQQTPVYACKAGGKNGAHVLSENIAANLYGTKSHLENWKHFVFNNKLPLFLNICLTIDQHNNSKDVIPFLVDKQYTDGEINQMFNFTTDEIEFMDKTIKKFERHSPFFKRYMCGKDSVSNEEVQKFIDSL